MDYIFTLRGVTTKVITFLSVPSEVMVALLFSRVKT